MEPEDKQERIMWRKRKFNTDIETDDMFGKTFLEKSKVSNRTYQDHKLRYRWLLH